MTCPDRVNVPLDRQWSFYNLSRQRKLLQIVYRLELQLGNRIMIFTHVVVGVGVACPGPEFSKVGSYGNRWSA